MIKEAGKLMAEAIEIVAGLCKNGIIKPQAGKPAYPDYVTWYGYAELCKDLVEIRHGAGRYRRPS